MVVALLHCSSNEVDDDDIMLSSSTARATILLVRIISGRQWVSTWLLPVHCLYHSFPSSILLLLPFFPTPHPFFPISFLQVHIEWVWDPAFAFVQGRWWWWVGCANHHPLGRYFGTSYTWYKRLWGWGMMTSQKREGKDKAISGITIYLFCLISVILIGDLTMLDKHIYTLWICATTVGLVYLG